MGGLQPQKYILAYPKGPGRFSSWPYNVFHSERLMFKVNYPIKIRLGEPFIV